jgi:hypothetical protein
MGLRGFREDDGADRTVIGGSDVGAASDQDVHVVGGKSWVRTIGWMIKVCNSKHYITKLAEGVSAEHIP